MVKIILLFFMLVFGLIILSVVMAGAFFSRLFGRRQSPQDIAVIQSLATLTPDERAVLAPSIKRGDPVIGILSDQQSIDSLLSRGVILQSEGPGGIIDYRIADAAWSVLRRSRNF